MSNKLFIQAIETNNGVYITESEKNRWNGSYLQNYLYDGDLPAETFHKSWLRLNNPPKRVTQIQSRPNINHRFILIDDSLASEKIPKELTREQAGTVIDCQTFQWKPEYEIYQSLYLPVSDEQSPIEIEVEFDYCVLARIDDVKVPQEISYPYKESETYGKTGNVTNENISYSIIDQIVYPTLTIHERPCKFSVKQTYEIIREHVKLNIDPRVAKTTTDYSAKFRVEKIIPLAQPYSYEYDKNRYSTRKRKPQMATSYVGDKKIICFEMASESDRYEERQVIEPFEGKNADDLKVNIDAYLKDLMGYINEPMKECSHCNGQGVLFNSAVEPVTVKTVK